MISDRIKGIMDSDHSYPFVSLATILYCISKLYEGVSHLRRTLYKDGLLPSHNLPCAVISVGNLVVGGTGKTPMVMHLAKLVQSMGHNVAIISRGYKGSAQNRGAVVSDGRVLLCGARQSGDEPYLMASLLKGIPVVVGRDRHAAGQAAIDSFRPDVLILDDAFQHLRLKRDLNLLLLDASKPFGNGNVLPRGRLREPVGAIAQADAVILTRSEKARTVSPHGVGGIGWNCPVYRCVHNGVVRGMVLANSPMSPIGQLKAAPVDLTGISAHAFAGLADNPSFFETISQYGPRVVGTSAFDDHHAFNRRDLQHLIAAAQETGAQCLITTDKDYVRLSAATRFPLDLIVVGVELDFNEDAASWDRYVGERIDSLVGRRGAAQ